MYGALSGISDRIGAAGSPYGTNGTDPLMPDRRSTVPAGKSNMGGVDNGLLTGGSVLGAVLGTQTKTLITSNLPAYTPSGTVAGTVPYQGFASDRVRVTTSVSQGSNNGGLLSIAISATFTGAASGRFLLRVLHRSTDVHLQRPTKGALMNIWPHDDTASKNAFYGDFQAKNWGNQYLIRIHPPFTMYYEKKPMPSGVPCEQGMRNSNDGGLQ